MDRKTKKIITPVENQEVVLYEWITGGDKMAMSGIKNDSDAQSVMISRMIVSVGGDKENVLQKMKDMHGKDYDFIINEMTKIVNDSSYIPEEKKSS